MRRMKFERRRTVVKQLLGLDYVRDEGGIEEGSNIPEEAGAAPAAWARSQGLGGDGLEAICVTADRATQG